MKIDKTNIPMKYILITLISLTFYVSDAQVVEYNKIDSIGLKQGQWREYKLIPSEIILNESVEDSTGQIIHLDASNLLDDPVIFMSQGNYTNGLKNGLWIEYWLNGKARIRMNYHNGVAFGEFKSYYPNGRIMLEGIINHSKEINVSSYSKDGELKGTENVATRSILEFLYLK